ncbi:MAG TPA: hypothetical protein VGQ81_01955 [Acidobacteriota bacterium]|nr:hypothetical protein [Acidobacteriota bacterium]
MEKPNLLFKQDELFVFDHEMAFAFTRLVGSRTGRWDEPSLNFLRNHPLHGGLGGKEVDLRRFEGELRSLQDEAIDEICRGVPPEFGTLHLEKIAEHWRDARDNAANITESVKRILR